jgi:hypothetical protein
VNPKAGDELHEHNLAGGVGAGGGAAAGAALGAVGGPIGMAAGAAIGGMAGGMAGKGAGGLVNPTEEDNYWRSNYQTQPYYTPGYTYDDYAPAYAMGYNNARRYPELRPGRAAHGRRMGSHEGQVAPVVGRRPSRPAAPPGTRSSARFRATSDRDGR